MKSSAFQRPFTIIGFGAPGVGKSNLLNIFANKPQYFKSSKSSASGETKKISHIKVNAFGRADMPVVHLFDVPGVADLELPVAEIVVDIKETIGTAQNFDAALILVKSTDYRIDVQQVIALKIIRKFFANFSPSNVFVIITHCDVENPAPEFI